MFLGDQGGVQLSSGQFGFHKLVEKFYPCRPERHLATAERERGRVEGSRRSVPYHAVTGNSTDDLLVCSIYEGRSLYANASRELPETDMG